ncbi:MAG: universal stress protein [Acidimicrobiia bacterium]
MTTVIVPLDGSAEAELALPHARALAGPGGELLLVTSIWHGEPIAPRRYFEDRALALVGDGARTRVFVEEPPATAILAAAVEQPDALICMASHGRNALGRAVLGSTAEAVVRGAAAPVMLVGPRAAFDRRRDQARNLVVAVDEHETADLLVPTATAFSDGHHLQLWAVESIQPAPYPFVPDADVPAVLPRDAEALAHTVELLTQDHRSAETKLLYGVDPADAIVHFATDLPATYVLMGSHGRQGVARVALGSVAMRVVHRSPCPVLVTHA